MLESTLSVIAEVMIICLGHLAYNIPPNARIKEYASKIFPDSRPFIRPHTLTNNPEKRILCRGDINPIHDMYSVRLCNASLIEFTDYKSGGQYFAGHINNVSINPDHVEFELFSSDILGDIKVLNALGFSSNPNSYSFSRIDRIGVNRKASIMLKHNNISKSYLDDIGFTCIAFLTSNIQTESSALIQAGCIDMTSIIDLLINGQKRLIWMARTPGGAIIELIQISRT